MRSEHAARSGRNIGTAERDGRGGKCDPGRDAEGGREADGELSGVGAPRRRQGAASDLARGDGREDGEDARDAELMDRRREPGAQPASSGPAPARSGLPALRGERAHLERVCCARIRSSSRTVPVRRNVSLSGSMSSGAAATSSRFTSASRNDPRPASGCRARPAVRARARSPSRTYRITSGSKSSMGDIGASRLVSRRSRNDSSPRRRCKGASFHD